MTHNPAEIDLSQFAPFQSRQATQPETLRRIAAMLNLEGIACAEGDPVPLGWHFPLLGAKTARHALRRDRFPGLGVPLPPIDLPRLLAVGRRVNVRRTLRVGELLAVDSRVASLAEKEAAAGRIAILDTAHAIAPEDGGEAAIEERQTYAFLASRHAEQQTRPWQASPGATLLGSTTPDDTMLFQFSALGFNPHRIHLDRTYAREVEGYPDLVVNGGLTTLLMTEIARTRLGLAAGTFAIANKAPLFVDREITFLSEPVGAGHRIVALDDRGVLAATMDITENGI